MPGDPSHALGGTTRGPRGQRYELPYTQGQHPRAAGTADRTRQDWHLGHQHDKEIGQNISQYRDVGQSGHSQLSLAEPTSGASSARCRRLFGQFVDFEDARFFLLADAEAHMVSSREAFDERRVIYTEGHFHFVH